MKVEITGQAAPVLTARSHHDRGSVEPARRVATAMLSNIAAKRSVLCRWKGRIDRPGNMANRGGGARRPDIAPTDTTFEYCKGRPTRPKVPVGSCGWTGWKRFTPMTTRIGQGHHHQRAKTSRRRTWGTSPEDVLADRRKVRRI